MYTVCMSDPRFVWDERKNRNNLRKHGVTFEEASTAFYDENARAFDDPDHSDEEDRFILLGLSFRLNVLVVCHCYRESESSVRIISARRADKQEQQDYGS
jgi:uncharacterized protein